MRNAGRMGHAWLAVSCVPTQMPHCNARTSLCMRFPTHPRCTTCPPAPPSHHPSYRPYPIQVVFGAALAPEVGEGVDALHTRYCAALTALAKEHGVPLTIAE